MRILLWLVVAVLAAGPFFAAVASPLLKGRDAIWVMGGLAGVAALGLLLVQPMLAVGVRAGTLPRAARIWHRWTGIAIAGLTVLHVAALYAYSPDDILDVLLFVSPTPFSVYGMIGLCGVVLTILVVALRRPLGLKPAHWRVVHSALAVVIVLAGAVHAFMIDGAMEPMSKLALCLAAVTATVVAVVSVNSGLLRSRQR